MLRRLEATSARAAMRGSRTLTQLGGAKLISRKVGPCLPGLRARSPPKQNKNIPYKPMLQAVFIAYNHACEWHVAQTPTPTTLTTMRAR